MRSSFVEKMVRSAITSMMNIPVPTPAPNAAKSPMSKSSLSTNNLFTSSRCIFNATFSLLILVIS
jgi:hypothetical protein